MKTEKVCLIFLATLITGGFSCKPSLTENKMPTKNGIAGTWKLIEYTDFDSVAHKWIYPYGKTPRGYFTYTEGGLVNLNVSAEKPLEISLDSEYIKPLTLGAVLDNAFGYFGTYTIDSVHSTVTHHVTGGSVIDYIGTDQSRQFILKGDTLLIGDPTFKIGKRVLIKEE